MINLYVQEQKKIVHVYTWTKEIQILIGKFSNTKTFGPGLSILEHFEMYSYLHIIRFIKLVVSIVYEQCTIVQSIVVIK